MPQTREPYWKSVPAERHEAYVKRLGNLALLDKTLNDKSGNLSFSDKVKALATSKIALTKELASYESWDINAIEDRQKRLAKIAVQAWPLKPS